MLAARAVGSIRFVRVQISRLRRGTGDIRQTDVAQMAAVLLALGAVVVDTDLLAGAIAVVVLAVLQLEVGAAASDSGPTPRSHPTGPRPRPRHTHRRMSSRAVTKKNNRLFALVVDLDQITT